MNLITIEAGHMRKLLDLHLSVETCQEICFHALNTLYSKMEQAKAGSVAYELPELLGAVPSCGLDASLPNAVIIEQVFAGMTTRTFQTIERLYCDPLGRSIPTVCMILDLEARRDGTRPPHHEAVTIVCLYLDKRRQEAVTVNVCSQDAEWQVGLFSLPFPVVSGNSRQFAPLVIYVVDAARDEVLSFRITDLAGINGAIGLALYDAIALKRRASADARDGLEWTLPRRLLLAQKGFVTPLAKVCTSLDIALEVLPSTGGNLESKTVADWHRRWCGAVDQSNPLLPLGRLEPRLDNTLFRLQGYGPKRLKAEKLRSYSALRGYSRDPALAFPEIRRLLPPYSGKVENGAVAYNGRHYAAELLALWPDYTVQIRRSAESEARTWIYLDDEILCEANAIELRRQDGTYRQQR